MSVHTHVFTGVTPECHTRRVCLSLRHTPFGVVLAALDLAIAAMVGEAGTVASVSVCFES
jgi:hypothetical protein